MNSFSIRAVLGACLALSLTPCFAASVKSEVVHVIAKKTAVLGSKGVSIPQLYVINGDGSLAFEGKPGATQAFPPVIAALRSPAAPAKPGQIAKLAPIVRMLQEQGVAFHPNDRPTIVSLESGMSVGLCNACTDYYPRLLLALRAMGSDVRWIRVNIERNDYKPVAAN